MRNVVLMSGISLDGFIEGRDRDISWHRVDEELHQHFNDELSQMGAFLSGRVTHELMAEFWPTADTDPDSTPAMVEFRRIWLDKPKYVYSKTLEHADWNTTIVRNVVAEEVLDLKRRPGGDLTLSGADLADTFLRLDLVDELRLYMHPVLVGAGTPLFKTSDRMRSFRLIATQTFGNGVVMLRYHRA